MKVYKANEIRNIAIVGHGGHGKTTFTEAVLYNSGVLERMGRVEDGNTVSDYDPEEIKRKISIGLSVIPVETNDCKINMIDVPGFFDFACETVSAYKLCDSALIVISASGNIHVGDEKAYAYCAKNGIPRAFLVNKIDKEHANFDKTIDALEARYATAVTPVQYPVMDGEKFVGVVDIIDMKAYKFDGNKGVECEIPTSVADKVESLREALIENAASNDEELMEKYFGGEELTKEDVIKGVREGIAAGSIAPVFVASAASNLGVDVVTSSLCEVMPAPGFKSVTAKDREGNEIELSYDEKGPLAVQVLKTIADPFVGKISIIKVFSGILTPDVQIMNTATGKPEKFGSMGFMRGKKLENTDKIYPGDIGALAKLQGSETGDTLCTAANFVALDKPVFPEPCITLAVTAKKKGEEEKIFAGLHRFEEEDPSFKMEINAETTETVVKGLGEMHLEVIMSKLKNKFGVEACLIEPKIPYRETIKKAAEAEGKHKKQSGGAGQFGVVNIRFEPIMYGNSEFEFVNNIVGGVVPKEFIPAVEKGLRESLKHGVLAGYPMVNIRATLFDGKYHPVDSKEVAFKSAARLAYKAACSNANPVILEPICKAEVLVPDECMGDIIGDLNRRRGRILGMNPVDGMQEVVAEVPMSEMVKYATDLRSMTRARGSFKLNFERYDELPAQMAAKIIEQAKVDDDE